MTPRPRSERPAASTLPVARVAVDVSLAHLDRPFDYLVPEPLADEVRAGARVRVRFSGRLVDGFVLERVEGSEHQGRLAFLERVVSPEPVLTPEIACLARAVADRYAGVLADVLRLAVPARHARAEAVADRAATDRAATDRAVADPPRAEAAEADAGSTGPPPSREPYAHGAGWGAYPQGHSFLRALADGRAPRAVWTALPGEDWPRRLAEAASTATAAGKSAVIIVPDARDLDRVDAALTAAGASHVALSAALGPQERYVRFLRALRGQVRIVAGTRAAAFAPVADLGLVVIWDDGDDLHSEPRAPYPHAREVLLTRALHAGAAALLGGFARTAEAAALLESGWARPIAADRGAIRRRAPLVTPSEDDARPQDPARLPTEAWRAARDALARDLPVLIQVPRRGYAPAVACARCRAPARCEHCRGPLSLLAAGANATCRWCARPSAGFACATCGGRALRASVVGARRTAEELGRTFADVPVRTSGRDGVLARVEAKPALVVATPGAEPIVDGGGYGAVLLLDTWAMLARADLRAGEETLRRWLAAAALAVPAERGGRVVVVADGALAPVQALLRFDPGWLAARDLAERRELGFPPAVRMASLTGASAAVAGFLDVLRLPAGAEVLGPAPVGEDQERFLVRVAKSGSGALAEALAQAAAVRSARKSVDIVRVRMDPLDLL